MTAQVKQVYYPEMEGLVKEATGAPNVIVFDHTVRESGLANLNNLGAMGMAAASVVRVHCDYTEESAPRRVKQLAESKSYTGVQLDLQQVQKILEGRFSFVNVWRNICDDSPVLTKPLAICDTNTVSRDDHILYQLAYEHRTGYTYSLPYSSEHRWYYYPKMSKDECLIFKVYDKLPDGPRFVFHTAFDDPTTPKDAPPRQSIEARAIAIWDDGPAKPVFYDMVQSNNAARIRLWLRYKGLEDTVTTKMIVYQDLNSATFKDVTPLQKVPAMHLGCGRNIWESNVILQYVEDKFGHLGAPQTTLESPEDMAFVELLCRTHDIYIASPNCTQPGFAHTQGCMYLAPYETAHCPAERAMDRASRAAKLAEIWKQLCWLEASMRGPCLAGDHVTNADFTWFPTCTFMEYMLPRVFGWPEVFRESNHFPRLTKWYTKLDANPVFGQVRREIWGYWEMKDKEGQFDPIRAETLDTTFQWKYPQL